MHSKDAALSIEGLSVIYRTERGELPAVRDVDLELSRGRALGLVGESGCGKTTLMLGAIGYLPANGSVSQGRARLGSTEMTSLTNHELRQVWGSRVGLVSQNPQNAFNPSMTVGRQLDEMGRLHLGLRRNTSREATLAMLGQVDMPEPTAVIDRYPHQLSGGMLQRAAIGMALLTDPELLILDEPTTALDTTTQALVLDLLQGLRDRSSNTMVYVTHDLGVVAQVCDEVAVMYAGRLLEHGPADKLFAQPLHPYTANLLACALRFDAEPGAKSATIPGAPPHLDDLPSGCTFAPRCPLNQPACWTADPPLTKVQEGRATACLRWEVLRSEAGRRSAVDLGETPEKDARHVGTPTPGAPGFGATHLVDIQDVTKRYRDRGRTTTRAVDGVSAHIGHAETLALVGESGSGKTTLARVVAGLAAPSSGGVSLEGQALKAEARQRSKDVLRSLQMVFQNPDASLNPRMTVGQALMRPLVTLAGLDRHAAKARMQELLAAVQLPAHYAERYPAELSGGEKQRAAIARAFAAAPELVICDEPISSLDVSVQGALMNLLVDLQGESGTAYLFISHDLAVVQHLSHRIAVMYKGALMEHGAAAEVLKPPYHPYTEALVSAVPIPDPEAEHMRVRLTKGQSATSDIPSGCRFHPRCPRYLGDICEREEPPWRATSDADSAHAVYCHIPLEELAVLQGDGGGRASGLREESRS